MEQRGERRTPQRQQIDLILENDKSVGAAKGPDGFVRFLYRKGTMLCREEYVDRIRDRLREDVSGESHGTVHGVRVMEVRDTMSVIAKVTQVYGAGVASPDHAVSITPGDCGCCPATEPEPVRADRRPRPALAVDPTLGAGVRVIVVDTGLDADSVARHPFLAGVTGDSDPGIVPPPGELLPYAGHGTFIAGVIRSVAPAAEVVVRKGFRENGVVFETDLVQTLIDVLDNDQPDVISMSAGTLTFGSAGLFTFDAFHQTYLSKHKGLPLIAAAGNNGDRQRFWPAASPWTVSVGSLDANWDQRAAFSDFGSWVDVFAPGEDIVSAFPEGEYTYREGSNTGRKATFEGGLARWSGTSFSTPLVAGLVAARMSQTGENGQTAAAALLAQARTSFRPGVGPVLLPA